MNKNLEIVKEWVEKFIVKHNICPFAEPVVTKNLIRYSSSDAKDHESMYHFFLDEFEKLQSSEASSIATSLIVFDQYPGDFEDFLYFIKICEQALVELEVGHLFQLVAFHPGFIFEGLDPSERANLVNRSPFPLIHLIRAEEIEAVMKDMGDGESISFRNEDYLNEMDESEFQKLAEFKYD